MRTRRNQTNKKTLELRYDIFFHKQVRLPIEQTKESLEQPTPLEVVPSAATSGAYEEPIHLDTFGTNA